MWTAPMKLMDTVQDLRAGRLGVQAYVREALDRIARAEPHVQALLPEPDREERLLREAADLESRYPDPAGRPALYGALLGVKDIFHVAGLPTRAGTRLPADLFQGDEAASVCALRAAGALVLGKTVTTEFAYFEPGPTRNPWNLEHTPGGSSSGSAAAVAAGFCALALGTQTVGSVIRPAAFCGVVGFKPSFERIPTMGIIPFSVSADTVGLFTQDAAGMELAAATLLAEWGTSGLAPVTRTPVLGLPVGPYLAQADAGTLEYLDRQLDVLSEAGYSVLRIPAFPDIADLNVRHNRMTAAEMAQVHAAWFPRYEQLYRPRTAALIREGLSIGQDELQRARESRLELRARLEQQMRTEGIDLWLVPSAPGTAPEGIGATGNPAFNLPWTHAGLPAITLPAGLWNGLPLGLQFVAAYKRDEYLLSVAAPLERALQRLMVR